MQPYRRLTEVTISDTFIGVATEGLIRRTQGLTGAFSFIYSAETIWTGEWFGLWAAVEVGTVLSADSIFTSASSGGTCTKDFFTEITFFLVFCADSVATKVRFTEVFTTIKWWALVSFLSARTITT